VALKNKKKIGPQEKVEMMPLGIYCPICPYSQSHFVDPL